MTATLIILAVSSTIGWFVALWSMRQLTVAKQEVAKQALATAEAQAYAAKSLAESRIAETSRKRAQDVVGVLRKAIREMEKDIDACNDPGAIRYRLRRLLEAPLQRASDSDDSDDAEPTAVLRRRAPADPSGDQDTRTGGGVPE